LGDVAGEDVGEIVLEVAFADVVGDADAAGSDAVGAELTGEPELDGPGAS
jgi:hypothetical protein